jgi:hypothetical protein
VIPRVLVNNLEVMEMALPAVKFFLRCNCGLKFRVDHVADGKVQILICECHSELKFFGTATKVHAGRLDEFAKERIWLEVPAENIKAA